MKDQIPQNLQDAETQGLQIFHKLVKGMIVVGAYEIYAEGRKNPVFSGDAEETLAFLNAHAKAPKNVGVFIITNPHNNPIAVGLSAENAWKKADAVTNSSQKQMEQEGYKLHEGTFLANPPKKPA